MKTIKFDLPIDGQTVATGDELRSHFTTEILGHFREGVLARWLHTRPEMEAELDAVRKLPADGDDGPTLLALCKAFGVDADEYAVEAALAVATGTPPSSSASPASRRLRDGQVSGNLAPGGEDKWLVDIPAPAVVQVDLHGSVDMACALENVLGRQFATDGTVERKQSASFAAILSSGTYCIRLRAVDQGEIARYNLRLRQDQEVRKSDLVGDNVLRPDDSVLTVRDLKIDVRREEANNGSYETIWEQDATLAAGCADLWVVDIPEKRASIRTLGNVDTVGCLLGPDGNVLAKDDNSGAALNFAMATPAPMSGEFAVLVCGSNSLADGEYRFRVTLEPASGRPRKDPKTLYDLLIQQIQLADEVKTLKSHGLHIVWDEFSYPRIWHS